MIYYDQKIRLSGLFLKLTSSTQRDMRMTYSEIRSKCRRQSDYIITLFVTNEIALLITWILYKTRITPNQVTIASIACALACAIFYALGYFAFGSFFLFFSHVFDCTDGNLARAKEISSPFGKLLDMIGDRISESAIFLGLAIYFSLLEPSITWLSLSLLNALLLSNYYYIVDIALTLGISNPIQNIGGLKFKGVRVKWGLLEPVIYGFIVFASFGLVKWQLVFILLITVMGILYQATKVWKYNIET